MFMKNMNSRLILFDLDGVLLDSKANMEASWLAVQETLGVTTPFPAYFSEIGKPFADIMDNLGLGDKARGAERIYLEASMANKHLLRWYDGVECMLLAVTDSSIKMGIVTSKDRQRTVNLVEQLPVAFNTIQSPTPGLRGKPAPDHLLIACAQTNVDPAETVFVGDMGVDQEAAERAGIAFAHASWGYGANPMPNVTMLGHVSEILDLVGLKS